MKNEIDNKLILSVYERIQQRGNNSHQAMHYQGITAFSDIDGYTLYLQGSGVLLRFGFHNTYHLKYEYEKQKDDFLKKLTQIASED
ncbi:DUF3081 family protein [Pseudoalteromonas sp. MMG010]|uniref:DUF3081 family protein n=1 Tax=Pseudoalteromonas sp. MMG010 TaxID=2822685 RepID=UPI001B3A72B6|nr:DUF3081 family protein [Pseudoalteromonas sp. MMG010]MBQ4833454.1 DUF3081 family protein [Pseudoalteromonas sp. MMG010]